MLVTMFLALYLLQSVLPAIYCLHLDVTSFQTINDSLQTPKNVIKNSLILLPETGATARSLADTISPRQIIRSYAERNNAKIPSTSSTKQVDEANKVLPAVSFPNGSLFTKDISNVTATSRLQNKPFLNLMKRRQKAHPDHQTASSNFSGLFSNSRISQKDNALNNEPARQCMCENLTCDCSNRVLTAVPQNLPINITKLSFEYNYFESLPDNAFSRYRHLEVLDMSNNQISSLEPQSFSGLDQLTALYLNRNSLTRKKFSPENVFKPLKLLKYLRLDVNKFECHKNDSFFGTLLSSLHSLEELHIDFHGQHHYDQGFRNLTSLRKMTVYLVNCAFDSINNSTFENVGQLESLTINYCRLVGRQIEYGAFSHFTKLLTLDLSSNPNIGLEQLPRITYGLRNSSLQTLVINGIVDKYSINFVKTDMTQYLPQTLTTLVARDNNIVYVDAQVIKTLPRNLSRVDISDNDVTMNPNTLPLSDMQQLETLVINNVNKECPISSDYTVSSYHDHFKFQMPKREQKCRKHMSEIKSTIPLKLKRIEMSVRDLDYDYICSINEDNNVEELDLSCSYLPTAEMDTFSRLLKLRYLNLRSSFIRVLIPPYNSMTALRTLVLRSNYLDFSVDLFGPNFRGMPNLIDLDLSFNQMTALTKDLFCGLDNLQYLRLSYNLFSDFVEDISQLQQLKLLNLSNTGLPYLPELVRGHIDLLTTKRPGQIQVDMSGCPIQCDCFNLDFLKWMTNSPAFDKNFIGYKCRHDTSIAHIKDGYQDTLRLLTRQCANNYPLYLVIVAGTVIILCLVIGLIIYRFRWKLRYLYYAAYLKVMDNERKEPNHQFVYDVFLSYDSEDTRFVQRCLVPELQKRDLVLLVHGRDFIAGTSIVANIVMAVAESRKTLVVLTRNLIESQWCNYEMQMATMEAVHTGRQVLLFLLKENIPNKELDVELLRYINTNTYLPYPCQDDEGNNELMKSFFDKLAHDLKS